MSPLRSFRCRMQAHWTLLLIVWGSAQPAGAALGVAGAVVSAEVAATETGLSILRRGGNAADAAVATALALVVVHPEAGNLGGGGFAVVKFGDELASLDFRETAPAAARPDMYLDSEGRPRPQASLLGPLAAGVPGSPAGLWQLHQRFGRLPWSTVVAPAHRLAASGFAVSERLHRSLQEERQELGHFAETAAVWLPDGEPPAVGSRIRQPALARTLESYASQGPVALTRGDAARAIERISSRYGGVLQADDLERYRAVWRPVVRFEAFGWSFAAMDQPSSGGIILGQSLTLLESLGFADLPPSGAARAHLLAEVWRRSFADRFLMGDPASAEVSAETLLSPGWLEWRRSTIEPARATLSSEVVPSSSPLSPESDDTTHVSVIDGEGNLVALTTTLNGLFGCKVLVPELGYFLNNEMDDFAVAPGHPNLYGLIQGEANAIAVGKRMLSSMSPTLAWKGEEALVAGGRGGSKIPTATAQVILSALVDERPLEAAVSLPRLHHQWLPDLLSAEEGALTDEARQQLEAWGHHITILQDVGNVNAARRHRDGRLEAAGDPRGPAAAATVQAPPEDRRGG